LRPGGRERPPLRRRRRRRRAGAAAGLPGDHRGRRVPRLAQHGCRGRPGAPRRQARRGHHPHRLDPGLRRADRRGAAPRRGARLVGVRHREQGEELPRRRLRHAGAARPQAPRRGPGARQAGPQRPAPRARRQRLTPAQPRKPGGGRPPPGHAMSADPESPQMLDLTADVRTLTARLVDTESVSGGERALADMIERSLSGLGHLRVDRDGDAVVARTGLGRAKRVVLAGHIDTVPIVDNVPSRRENDRLYGCGSSDMKSGVAVQLRLAAALTEPVHDLTYVFYDCEEVDAERNGLRRLSRDHPDWLAGDFAVLLEPTGGVIEGGCQGTMRVEVIARGERAHSARSWMGENAIHGAGRILDVLRGYVPREPEVDGLRYREGLNAVFVSGGV